MDSSRFQSACSSWLSNKDCLTFSTDGQPTKNAVSAG